MNQRISVALACAALWGVCASAQAATATFDDTLIDIIGAGGSIASGGLTFSQGGDFGGVFDNAAFMFGNAPTGNATQYYAGFNDSSVTMTMTDGSSFSLTGLSYAFIAPLEGVYAPGAEPAALTITALSVTGASWTSTYSFGAAAGDGSFAFLTLSAADLGGLATSDLRSVTFAACNNDGACLSPYFNHNQFALDNVTAVPEPAALVLALMGLGVVGAAARRGRAA